MRTTRTKRVVKDLGSKAAEERVQLWYCTVGRGREAQSKDRDKGPRFDRRETKRSTGLSARALDLSVGSAASDGNVREMDLMVLSLGTVCLMFLNCRSVVMLLMDYLHYLYLSC